MTELVQAFSDSVAVIGNVGKTLLAFVYEEVVTPYLASDLFRSGFNAGTLSGALGTVFFVGIRSLQRRWAAFTKPSKVNVTKPGPSEYDEFMRRMTRGLKLAFVFGIVWIVALVAS